MRHIKPLIELSQLSHETDELAKITHDVYALTTPYSWRYEGRKDKLYFSESLKELLEWPILEDDKMSLDEFYMRVIHPEDRERIQEEAKRNNNNNIDGAEYNCRILTAKGKVVNVKVVSFFYENFKLGYMVPR
jgi:hypothetical protein